MKLIKPIASVTTAVVFTCGLTGCASGYVQRGAAVGALTGAVAGAGIGWVASDPNLLGPSNSAANGKVGLPVGASIGAGALIGVVVGSVVGAMVGHRRDEGYEEPKKLPPPSSGNKAEQQGGESTADSSAPALSPEEIAGRAQARALGL
jgi:hypothetical protein